MSQPFPQHHKPLINPYSEEWGDLVYSLCELVHDNNIDPSVYNSISAQHNDPSQPAILNFSATLHIVWTILFYLNRSCPQSIYSFLSHHSTRHHMRQCRCYSNHTVHNNQTQQRSFKQQHSSQQHIATRDPSADLCLWSQVTSDITTKTMDNHAHDNYLLYRTPWGKRQNRFVPTQFAPVAIPLNIEPMPLYDIVTKLWEKFRTNRAQYYQTLSSKLEQKPPFTTSFHFNIHTAWNNAIEPLISDTTLPHTGDDVNQPHRHEVEKLYLIGRLQYNYADSTSNVDSSPYPPSYNSLLPLLSHFSSRQPSLLVLQDFSFFIPPPLALIDPFSDFNDDENRLLSLSLPNSSPTPDSQSQYQPLPSHFKHLYSIPIQIYHSPGPSNDALNSFPAALSLPQNHPEHDPTNHLTFVPHWPPETASDYRFSASNQPIKVSKSLYKPESRSINSSPQFSPTLEISPKTHDVSKLIGSLVLIPAGTITITDIEIQRSDPRSNSSQGSSNPPHYSTSQYSNDLNLQLSSVGSILAENHVIDQTFAMKQVVISATDVNIWIIPQLLEPPDTAPPVLESILEFDTDLTMNNYDLPHEQPENISGLTTNTNINPIKETEPLPLFYPPMAPILPQYLNILFQYTGSHPQNGHYKFKNFPDFVTLLGQPFNISPVKDPISRLLTFGQFNLESSPLHRDTVGNPDQINNPGPISFEPNSFLHKFPLLDKPITMLFPFTNTAMQTLQLLSWPAKDATFIGSNNIPSDHDSLRCLNLPHPKDTKLPLGHTSPEAEIAPTDDRPNSSLLPPTPFHPFYHSILPLYNTFTHLHDDNSGNGSFNDAKSSEDGNMGLNEITTSLSNMVAQYFKTHLSRGDIISPRYEDHIDRKNSNTGDKLTHESFDQSVLNQSLFPISHKSDILATTGWGDESSEYSTTDSETEGDGNNKSDDNFTYESHFEDNSENLEESPSHLHQTGKFDDNHDVSFIDASNAHALNSFDPYSASDQLKHDQPQEEQLSSILADPFETTMIGNAIPFENDLSSLNSVDLDITANNNTDNLSMKKISGKRKSVSFRSNDHYLDSFDYHLHDFDQPQSLDIDIVLNSNHKTPNRTNTYSKNRPSSRFDRKSPSAHRSDPHRLTSSTSRPIYAINFSSKIKPNSTKNPSSTNYGNYTPLDSLDPFSDPVYLTQTLPHNLERILTQKPMITPSTHHIGWGDDPILEDFEVAVDDLGTRNDKRNSMDSDSENESCAETDTNSDFDGNEGGEKRELVKLKPTKLSSMSNDYYEDHFDPFATQQPHTQLDTSINSKKSSQFNTTTSSQFFDTTTFQNPFLSPTTVTDQLDQIFGLNTSMFPMATAFSNGYNASQPQITQTGVYEQGSPLRQSILDTTTINSTFNTANISQLFHQFDTTMKNPFLRGSQYVSQDKRPFNSTQNLNQSSLSSLFDATFNNSFISFNTTRENPFLSTQHNTSLTNLNVTPYNNNLNTSQYGASSSQHSLHNRTILPQSFMSSSQGASNLGVALGQLITTKQLYTKTAFHSQFKPKVKTALYAKSSTHQAHQEWEQQRQVDLKLLSENLYQLRSNLKSILLLLYQFCLASSSFLPLSALLRFPSDPFYREENEHIINAMGYPMMFGLNQSLWNNIVPVSFSFQLISNPTRISSKSAISINPRSKHTEGVEKLSKNSTTGLFTLINPRYLPKWIYSDTTPIHELLSMCSARQLGINKNQHQQREPASKTNTIQYLWFTSLSPGQKRMPMNPNLFSLPMTYKPNFSLLTTNTPPPLTGLLIRTCHYGYLFTIPLPANDILLDQVSSRRQLLLNRAIYYQIQPLGGVFKPMWDGDVIDCSLDNGDQTETQTSPICFPPSLSCEHCQVFIKLINTAQNHNIQCYDINCMCSCHHVPVQIHNYTIINSLPQVHLNQTQALFLNSLAPRGFIDQDCSPFDEIINQPTPDQDKTNPTKNPSHPLKSRSTTNQSNSAESLRKSQEQKFIELTSPFKDPLVNYFYQQCDILFHPEHRLRFLNRKTREFIDDLQLNGMDTNLSQFSEHQNSNQHQSHTNGGRTNDFEQVISSQRNISYLQPHRFHGTKIYVNFEDIHGPSNGVKEASPKTPITQTFGSAHTQPPRHPTLSFTDPNLNQSSLNETFTHHLLKNLVHHESYIAFEHLIRTKYGIPSTKSLYSIADELNNVDLPFTSGIEDEEHQNFDMWGNAIVDSPATLYITILELSQPFSVPLPTSQNHSLSFQALLLVENRKMRLGLVYHDTIVPIHHSLISANKPLSPLVTDPIKIANDPLNDHYTLQKYTVLCAVMDQLNPPPFYIGTADPLADEGVINLIGAFNPLIKRSNFSGDVDDDCRDITPLKEGDQFKYSLYSTLLFHPRDLVRQSESPCSDEQSKPTKKPTPVTPSLNTTRDYSELTGVVVNLHFYQYSYNLSKFEDDFCPNFHSGFERPQHHLAPHLPPDQYFGSSDTNSRSQTPVNDVETEIPIHRRRSTQHQLQQQHQLHLNADLILAAHSGLTHFPIIKPFSPTHPLFQPFLISLSPNHINNLALNPPFDPQDTNLLKTKSQEWIVVKYTVIPQIDYHVNATGSSQQLFSTAPNPSLGTSHVQTQVDLPSPITIFFLHPKIDMTNACIPLINSVVTFYNLSPSQFSFPLRATAPTPTTILKNPSLAVQDSDNYPALSASNAVNTTFIGTIVSHYTQHSVFLTSTRQIHVTQSIASNNCDQPQLPNPPPGENPHTMFTHDLLLLFPILPPLQPTPLSIDPQPFQPHLSKTPVIPQPTESDPRHPDVLPINNLLTALTTPITESLQSAITFGPPYKPIHHTSNRPFICSHSPQFTIQTMTFSISCPNCHLSNTLVTHHPSATSSTNYSHNTTFGNPNHQLRKVCGNCSYPCHADVLPLPDDGKFRYRPIVTKQVPLVQFSDICSLQNQTNATAILPSQYHGPTVASLNLTTLSSYLADVINTFKTSYNSSERYAYSVNSRYFIPHVEPTALKSEDTVQLKLTAVGNEIRLQSHQNLNSESISNSLSLSLSQSVPAPVINDGSISQSSTLANTFPSFHHYNLYSTANKEWATTSKLHQIQHLANSRQLCLEIPPPQFPTHPSHFSSQGLSSIQYYFCQDHTFPITTPTPISSNKSHISHGFNAMLVDVMASEAQEQQKHEAFLINHLANLQTLQIQDSTNLIDPITNNNDLRKSNNENKSWPQPHFTEAMRWIRSLSQTKHSLGHFFNNISHLGNIHQSNMFNTHVTASIIPAISNTAINGSSGDNIGANGILMVSTSIPQTAIGSAKPSHSDRAAHISVDQNYHQVYRSSCDSIISNSIQPTLSQSTHFHTIVPLPSPAILSNRTTTSALLEYTRLGLVKTLAIAEMSKIHTARNQGQHSSQSPPLTQSNHFVLGQSQIRSSYWQPWLQPCPLSLPPPSHFRNKLDHQRNFKQRTSEKIYQYHQTLNHLLPLLATPKTIGTDLRGGNDSHANRDLGAFHTPTVPAHIKPWNLTVTFQAELMGYFYTTPQVYCNSTSLALLFAGLDVSSFESSSSGYNHGSHRSNDQPFVHNSSSDSDLNRMSSNALKQLATIYRFIWILNGKPFIYDRNASITYTVAQIKESEHTAHVLDSPHETTKIYNQEFYQDQFRYHSLGDGVIPSIPSSQNLSKSQLDPGSAQGHHINSNRGQDGPTMPFITAVSSLNQRLSDRHNDIINHITSVQSLHREAQLTMLNENTVRYISANCDKVSTMLFKTNYFFICLPMTFQQMSLHKLVLYRREKQIQQQLTFAKQYQQQFSSVNTSHLQSMPDPSHPPSTSPTPRPVYEPYYPDAWLGKKYSYSFNIQQFNGSNTNADQTPRKIPPSLHYAAMLHYYDHYFKILVNLPLIHSIKSRLSRTETQQPEGSFRRFFRDLDVDYYFDLFTKLFALGVAHPIYPKLQHVETKPSKSTRRNTTKDDTSLTIEDVAKMETRGLSPIYQFSNYSKHNLMLMSGDIQKWFTPEPDTTLSLSHIHALPQQDSNHNTTRSDPTKSSKPANSIYSKKAPVPSTAANQPVNSAVLDNPLPALCVLQHILLNSVHRFQSTEHLVILGLYKP